MQKLRRFSLKALKVLFLVICSLNELKNTNLTLLVKYKYKCFRSQKFDNKTKLLILDNDRTLGK